MYEDNTFINLKSFAMKSYKTLILIVLFFFPLVIFAQDKELEQIFLVNNKNYIGSIIEQKPGEYIKFQVHETHDTLTIAFDDIEKIVKLKMDSLKTNMKENGAPGKTNKTKETGDLFNTRPISLQLHYGLGGGDVSFTRMGFGLYRNLGTSYKVGISTSYFGENGYNPNKFLQFQKIPVMAEFLYDINRYSKNRMALFSRLGAGYSFTLNGSYYDPDRMLSFKQTNGLAFNLGIGYRLNVFKNTGFLFDVNYSLIIDQNESDNNSLRIKNLWDNILFSGHLFF